ncbi:MAG: 2-amino-4-hydroxy-6-hydroxymethyldihydropteridine diphosphokinase [Leptolinea sp.]|jgi:2-amino-4-hydroxy-6-hydroxymethyldihydropteridine diphosphokinase|nr:2-amino-4-hydroxy-6-hydroxymethyldihydropteridine diphosphokinase [Leptolinea sp.]
MREARVFLGVGTNLGNRRANLSAAQTAVSSFVIIQKTSRVYETAPWGLLDQPDFLNQVWEGITTLTPPDLLHHLKQVETELGRKPSVRYGPRLIDIDILLYSNLMFKSAELIIPHPRISERAFVLAPLADLEPDLVIPGMQHTVAELLGRHSPRGIKVLKS